MGRKLAVMAVMAVGAVLALRAVDTAPAAAQGSLADVVYECSFTGGLAGGITPPVSTTPFFGGFYEFSGAADCTANGVNIANAFISSTGTFINVVCGTGVVTGHATVTGSLNGTALTVEADYRIVFNATVGEVVITGGEHVQDGRRIAGGTGAVQILPSAGDCISGVGAFSVRGAFTAVEA